MNLKRDASTDRLETVLELYMINSVKINSVFPRAISPSPPLLPLMRIYPQWTNLELDVPTASRTNGSSNLTGRTPNPSASPCGGVFQYFVQFCLDLKKKKNHFFLNLSQRIGFFKPQLPVCKVETNSSLLTHPKLLFEITCESHPSADQDFVSRLLT
uniref:Uncharacterized protein n=1 Tax=Micrurus spixii TaxID=129469 RepID=A0A2D4MNY2_9SAUR